MLSITGNFNIDIVRDGKVVVTESGHNGIAYDGLSKILDVHFGNTTGPISSSYNFGKWYCGLIREKSNLAATTLSPTDTASSHDFQVFSDLTEDTLPVWSPDIAYSIPATTSKNSQPMLLHIASNSAPRVIGMYICNCSSKTSTDPSGWGILWASALFGPYEVKAGDMVKIIYSVTMGVTENAYINLR